MGPAVAGMRPRTQGGGKSRPPAETPRPGRAGGSLRGALAGAAVGAAGGVAAGYRLHGQGAADPQAASTEGRLPAVPFHGRHQAGILPPAQRQTVVASFDVTAQGRGELGALLRALTARARFLTAGGVPPPVGISASPSDSGVLGPVVVPDGLTVTVGVGASLFDERYGLAARRPAGPHGDGGLPQRSA